MGCHLCRNSEFYEFAMKCWYLRKLTGIYELSYWYLRSMLILCIHSRLVLILAIVLMLISLTWPDIHRVQNKMIIIEREVVESVVEELRRHGTLVLAEG